ncbi:MAG: hypothetical protein WCS85_05675 [Candidatus Peribacteraceae bacterium]
MKTLHFVSSLSHSRGAAQGKPRDPPALSERSESKGGARSLAMYCSLFVVSLGFFGFIGLFGILQLVTNGLHIL